MSNNRELSLPIAGKQRDFFYDELKIKPLCDDIEHFLNTANIKNTLKYTKSVLFPFEVKYNNSIEDYHEDIQDIIEIIKNPDNMDLKSKENYQRIRNLINGYQFILQKNTISDTTLKKLYDVLSHNLLEPQDVLPNDQHYRPNDVFIYYSPRLDVVPDKGVDAKYLDDYMKVLLDYINCEKNEDTTSLTFVKSQIMHLYFVYLHPYYDVNGRTARTLSLWYLNMNHANAFSMFNRGITFNKKDYYKLIRYSIKNQNMTPFLVYMLDSVKKELEKESIINNIEKNVGELPFFERQTLQYILESKVPTAIDFTTFYNRFNPRKKPFEVHEQLLQPLLSKQIIMSVRETNGHIDQTQKNYVYNLNRDLTSGKSLAHR